MSDVMWLRDALSKAERDLEEAISLADALANEVAVFGSSFSPCVVEWNAWKASR